MTDMLRDEAHLHVILVVATEVAGDPYGRIKKMLKELHLEELWSMFEENAVRVRTLLQVFREFEWIYKIKLNFLDMADNTVMEYENTSNLVFLISVLHILCTKTITLFLVVPRIQLFIKVTSMMSKIS